MICICVDKACFNDVTFRKSAAILDDPLSLYDGIFFIPYDAKLNHLLQYMIINQMKNLAFRGHFGLPFQHI